MDIVALIFLTRDIGNRARRKGLSVLRWRWMLVLLWISLELIGLYIGASISGNLLSASLMGFVAGLGAYFLMRRRLEVFPDTPPDDFLENLGR